MYNKILAPLDGSEVSECGLDHVKALASGCKVGEVVLFRVVVPIPSSAYVAYAETGGDWVAGGDWMAKQEKQNYLEAENYLTQIAENLTKEGLNVQIVVASGRPAEAILDYARDNAVDLIIMSTRGKTGLSRWIRGSVVGRVARYSPIPILTIPPSESKSDVKSRK